MARKASGETAIAEARSLLKKAKTADELRAAQAVVLPLDLKLSLADTARALGRSSGSVARLRSNFINGKPGERTPLPRGGARRQMISAEKVADLVPTAIRRERAKWWQGVFLDEFRGLVEEQIGRPIAKSTAYRLYARGVRQKLLDQRLKMIHRIFTY